MPITPCPEHAVHPDDDPHSLNRRSFLAATGLAMAGTAVLTLGIPGVAQANPVNPALGVSSTAPVILRRQIRTVQPGEAFLLAGNGFGVTSRAVAVPLSQSHGNRDLPATPPRSSLPLRVVSATGTQIVLMLPARTPIAVYAIYISSPDRTAWSAPLLANAAQAWYVDAPRPTSGAKITLYGENLTLGRARPWVGLRSGSTTVSCHVVAATRYSLTMTVPHHLSGSHQLVVSNGYGAAVAADTSVTLNIVPATAAPRAVIDSVRDHGADPSGAGDSTGALQAALDAASAAPGGAVVRIPRGTYRISAKLMLTQAKGPVVVSGAGRGCTTITMSDDVIFTPSLPRGTPTDIYGVSADDDSGMLYLAPSQIPVEVRGLTFDTNQRRVVALELDASDNVTLCDVGVENVGYPQDVWLYVGCFGLLGQNLRNLLVDRCDFHTANGAFLIGVTDVVVQNSLFRLFYPRNPTDEGNPERQADNSGIKVWGAKRLTLRNNTFKRGSETFYYARAVQTGALKTPNSVFGAQDAAGIEDAFYGGNTVIAAGQPAGNCGEALVGDQFNSVQGGRQYLNTSASTSTTISVAADTFGLDSDRQDPVGTTVVVTSGIGVGQLRKVIANTTTTLTVDEPWDVLPGNDSTFVVILLHLRQLYIGNKSRSSPKYLGNYGPSALCIAANKRLRLDRGGDARTAGHRQWWCTFLRNHHRARSGDPGHLPLQPDPRQQDRRGPGRCARRRLHLQQHRPQRCCTDHPEQQCVSQPGHWRQHRDPVRCALQCWAPTGVGQPGDQQCIDPVDPADCHHRCRLRAHRLPGPGRPLQDNGVGTIVV